MSGRAELLEAIMALVRANYENGALAERFDQNRATREELRQAAQTYNRAYRRMAALLDLWPYRELEADFTRRQGAMRTLELTDPCGRRN